LVGGRRPLGRRRTNGWDRVQSAGRPGMATSEASYGEDGTPHGSVLLHGLQRIGRARRVVAADLAVKRTDDRAVGLEHADQNVLHRTGPISRARQWSRSAPSRRAEAAPAGASARTIINGASGIEASRSLMRWRSRRRVRLRVTAPPTERPTMNPTRAESLGGPARCMSAWTTTVALPARRPLRTTAVNSSRDRIRAPAGNTTAGSVELRQPDAGDPSAADSTAPNDRPGCASAGGSHASCADAGCWAETYACSLRTAPGQEISYMPWGGRHDDSHHRVTPSCPSEGTRQSSNAVRPQNDTGLSTASSNARDARFGRIAPRTCGQPLVASPESLLRSRDQLGFPQARGDGAVHILWKTVWKPRGFRANSREGTTGSPRQ